MALNTFAFDPGAQRWDGRRWIATNMPTQGASGSNGVEGLSCSGATNCVAVAGDVAWAWDGTSWNESSTGIGGQQTVDLQSVSCLSATLCMATGFDFTGDCQESCTISGLAEQWNGASWSVSDNPVLGPGSLDSLPVSQISCLAAAFCMEETTGVGVNSVRSWNGHAWAPHTVPFSDAFAISCGGTSSCVVMTAHFQGGALAEVAEVWNGSTWRATRPVPGGQLGALSCFRPSRCVAVGATAADLTMAQFWDGTTWKLGRPANP